MNRVLADLRAFGKQYMRSKIGAFFTFIFPILLILLFGAIYNQAGTTTFDLPVQDLDGTRMSTDFVNALNNTTVVRVAVIPADTDIREYVRAHSLDLALAIPAGFQEDVIDAVLLGGGMVNVTLYGDPSQATFGMAQGVIGAVAEQMNFYLTGARPVIGMAMESVASETFRYIDYFLPGIVGMTAMTNALFTMTSVCAEYRTRKYFKLLGTTTLTKAEWLASKILWFSLILTLSLFATVAVGMAVWNVQVRIDAVSLALIVTGAVLFTSMGMVLGSVIKDPESGVALANAIGFPMMFLSGSFFPLEAMPEYLRNVSLALPLTYLNNGLRDAMVYQNLEPALVNLGILGILAVGFFVLAAKVMSWKQR